MVPLDDHWTRVINHAVIVQPLPGLVKKLAAARPRWIDHLLLNEIFDGDTAYLAKASEIAKRRDLTGGSWAQDYFMPANSDGCANAHPEELPTPQTGLTEAILLWIGLLQGEHCVRKGCQKVYTAGHCCVAHTLLPVQSFVLGGLCPSSG